MTSPSSSDGKPMKSFWTEKNNKGHVIWPKPGHALRPLAGFVYKYFADGKKILEEDQDPNAYRTSSVWAQNFSQHWAKNIIPSCGPWISMG